jgi:hypothetical protein
MEELEEAFEEWMEETSFARRGVDWDGIARIGTVVSNGKECVLREHWEMYERLENIK